MSLVLQAISDQCLAGPRIPRRKTEKTGSIQRKLSRSPNLVVEPSRPYFNFPRATVICFRLGRPLIANDHPIFRIIIKQSRKDTRFTG